MSKLNLLTYGRQEITQGDVEAVVEALNGQLITSGPQVQLFQTKFAELTGANYSLACANGTAALHLACLSLGLGPGDTAIVPVISFVATANAVLYTGADVIFSDVDSTTGLMTPQNLLEALHRARDKNIKVVIPVHLSGRICEMETISEIAKKHGLQVIEDASHALGSAYTKERYRVGGCLHSDITTFSFHPVKTLTTGEGGMLTTNDTALNEKISSLMNHGICRDLESFQDAQEAFEVETQKPWYYEMTSLGFNYRITDIQCALGVSQLKRLPYIVSRRRALFEQYIEAFKVMSPMVKMISTHMDDQPGWHLAIIHIDFEELGITRTSLMAGLKALGIGTQVHYIPIANQPYYKARYGEQKFDGADSYYSTCLTLPLFPQMDDSDVQYVADSVAKLLCISK